MHIPFYNPLKSYYENYDEGPFGIFGDGEVIPAVSAPSVDFFGHKIHAPFGIAAGPLLNARFVKAALDKGFDVPVYKTVRSGMHESHPYPNVLPIEMEGDLTLELANEGLVAKENYDEPLSITNSFGVPSYDPDFWQADARQAILYAKEGQVVGISFQGTKWEGGTADTYIEDWVTTAKLVAEVKPGFIEANLSCPNEGTTALLCFDIEKVSKIATKIKEAVGDMPLFLKISFFTDNSLLENLVLKVGSVVEGFATINTISAEVRTNTGEQALPGEGRLRSGVCGESIRWAGLDMVSRLARFRTKHSKNYTIIGVGGVSKLTDYERYRQQGADVVMSATGAMWNPYLAQEIKSI